MSSHWAFLRVFFQHVSATIEVGSSQRRFVFICYAFFIVCISRAFSASFRSCEKISERENQQQPFRPVKLLARRKKSWLRKKNSFDVITLYRILVRIERFVWNSGESNPLMALCFLIGTKADGLYLLWHFLFTFTVTLIYNALNNFL